MAVDDEGPRFEGLNAHGPYSSYEDPPDGPSPLGWAGSGRCLFCQSRDTVWQHDLNASLATYRTLYGKQHVWGGGQTLCDRCEDLYSQHEYAELARLRTTDQPAYDDELADQLAALVAFARSDRGPRRLPEPDFPVGYRPIGELTGAEWLFDLWPVEWRMTVAETRSPQVDDNPGAVIQLVSSPWPSLTLDEVFRILWTWVEQDKGRLEMPEMQAVMPARAAELLGWPEAKAVDYLRAIS